ncbi:MAG: biotin--[acetyl-CoA-carboxylase] ligase [Phycisphaerales bacterium]
MAPTPPPPLTGEFQHLAATAREGALGEAAARVHVVAECSSTQDVARSLAAAGDALGTVVIACRQTAGRGRLGRSWVDERGMGVATTFITDAGPGAPFLALAAGLAAHRAAQVALPHDRRLGLRWPNDVVEMGQPQRKAAGVLVEVTGRTALVGIGINVLQQARDWPEALAARAVSLAQLGSSWSRAQVVDSLASMLSLYLARPAHELAAAWQRLDTLVGSERTFEHNGAFVTGCVEAIDPLARITLRTAGGEELHLPALTTSLVHP